MYKQSMLYMALVLLSTSLYAVQEIPPLQELIAQRIINEEGLELSYIYQYFKDLNIDINQLTPKAQQTFFSGIQKRFGQQLDNMAFVRTLRGHTAPVTSVIISSNNKFIKYEQKTPGF